MNGAVAASVSAVVWAALITGVGYSASAAFVYGFGFFVASVLFLGVMWPREARRVRDD
jgi:hypothetical protein